MRLKISLIIFIVTFFFFRTSALLQAGVIPGGWEKVDSQPQGAQIEESETPNRLLFRNSSQPGRQEITARYPISARVATLGKTGSSESRMFTGINDILPDWDHLFLIRDRLWEKDADEPSAGDKYQKIQVRLLLGADQLEIRDALTEEPLKADLVKPSWDEVNQTQQQRDRLINEARGEGNRVIPRAEGEAQHTISRAQKRYALDRVNRAQGDATAQEFPVELVVGYGYARPEGGQANLHGWHLSVAGNVNNWFGLVGEFSGQYGSQTLSVAGPSGGMIDVKSDATFYSFGFGPRFTYRNPERLSPFAHALFGISRGDWVGPATVSGAETSFGMALGGGFDMKLAERVGFRILQAEYVQTHFGEDTENHFRISAGITFHLGSRLAH